MNTFDSYDFLITPYGVRMPKIIYGTAWKKARTTEWVVEAISQGFRGIDTACQPKHYHEQGVGDGISHCIAQGIVNRQDLYVQTKFTPVDGHDPLQIPYNPTSPLSEQIDQSVKVSLDNLQTHYLDCLVLHSPLPSFEATCQAWLALEYHVNKGTIKQIGISNCYDAQFFGDLYDFAGIKPAVLQNRFYQRTGYDVGLRDYCRQHHVVYQSFWTLTANPHVLESDTVQHLAGKYERTPAQIFFRYLSQRQIVPLTGTTSTRHMQEDLAIFDLELTSDECEAIDLLLAKSGQA